MPPTFTLSKQERLKSRKRIEQVFAEGKRLQLSAFRISYLLQPATTGSLQMGVGVSSKNFKKAVDRNQIKRWIREAWRLQKNDLKDQCKQSLTELSVFIVFTGKEMPDYNLVSSKIKEAITKLAKAVKI